MLSITLKPAYAALLPVIAAAVFATAADAQTQNPPVRIYQFSGVYQNDSTNNTGTATIFTCTNFSSNSASLRFVMRDANGTTILDRQTSLPTKNTFTFSTKATTAHAEYIMGASGSYVNASMAIVSSELEVRCMGKVTPAAASDPQGYVLPAARFFQTSGASE